MKTPKIDSPSSLFAALAALFPPFAVEFDDEEIRNYHHVLQLLAPRVTAFLQASPDCTKQFAALLNSMVSNGGDQENAASTCLLEHASQIRIQKLIGPHLSAEAKRQLR